MTVWGWICMSALIVWGVMAPLTDAAVANDAPGRQG